MQTVKWLNSSILLINETLINTTSPAQSEPGSNGCEEVFNILQSSSI